MKMIKLTKIFKINANFGDIVEICKEFNNKKVKNQEKNNFFKKYFFYF